MVHAEDGIELPVRCPPEDGVRAEWPGKRCGGACGREQRESGFDQATLFVTEIPLFSSVGIEPCHGDAGGCNPSPVEEGSQKRSDSDDLLRREQ